MHLQPRCLRSTGVWCGPRCVEIFTEMCETPTTNRPLGNRRLPRGGGGGGGGVLARPRRLVLNWMFILTPIFIHVNFAGGIIHVLACVCTVHAPTFRAEGRDTWMCAKTHVFCHTSMRKHMCFGTHPCVCNVHAPTFRAEGSRDAVALLRAVCISRIHKK